MKNIKNSMKIVEDSQSQQESELSDIVTHPAFSKKQTLQIKKQQKKQISYQCEEQHEIIKQSKINKKQEVFVKKQEKNISKYVNNEFDKTNLLPKLQNKSLQKPNDDNFQICVQGLSFKAYGSDIRKLFEDCGKIIKLKVPTDSSGKSKGLAFIKFGNKEQSQLALEKNGIEHMGRYLKIKKGQKKETTAHLWKQKGFPQPNMNNPTNTLFIGGINPTTGEQTLRGYFQQFGKIKDIRILYNQFTGLNPGYGYIQFENISSAGSALKSLNQTNIDGRIIRLDFATSKKMVNSEEKKLLAKYEQ